MIVTATDSFPGIQRSVTGFTNKQVRLKIKKISGLALESMILTSSGALTDILFYDGKVEHIHDYFITSGATGNLGLYPGYIGSAAGDVYEISFIYIGTGEYLPRKDATGNHLIKTVGSVPVPGISGNGIRRDGVCAYEKTLDAVPMPDVFTFSKWIDGEEPYTNDYYFDANDGTDFVRIIRNASLPNYFTLIYKDSIETKYVLITDFFTEATLYAFEIDFTNETFKAYRSGVLFSTHDVTGIVKPDATPWYFGSTSTPAYFATGTFDELRIWSRALSAEEHYNLFRSKSRGPVTHIYANALNRGTAPISASDPGYEGETRITDTYLYIYTNGAWRRFAVTGW
jgi:hypothetical protein